MRRAVDGLLDEDGDRISVTDANGTIARFEMTYSPRASPRTKFGPPLPSRVPSALYLVGALLIAAAVAYAYALAPSSSALFVWIVEGDRRRPISTQILAAIVLVSAVGTVLRTHMRGVLVSDDWIEARYLLPLGIPRAKRWGWAQVLRVVVDGNRIGLELWDGSFERLPEVAKEGDLFRLMLQHAQRRRIAVTDLDDAAR
ncbi:MAG: hypothetical protein M3O36_12550 [Myxococcota bacterium]|nr:hypothetical protein [Myxococcota bacterium]